MSDVYKELIYPNEINYFANNEINRRLVNLNIMGASSFYPVVLSMVNNAYKEDDILIIVKSIETLIFRNCVVAGKVTNKYEILFGKIAYKISEKEFTTVKEIYNEIKKDTLTDEDLKVVFSTFNIKSVNVAKYVLRELNDSNSNEVKTVTDNSKIHLEHIMPKRKGQWDVDDEVHEKYLNRLGNLTLLADEYNKSIQNKTFDKKKSIYKKSRLQITNDLCEYQKWDRHAIEDRQNILFDQVIKIWCINKI